MFGASRGVLAVVGLLVATACSGGGAASGTRSIVVLSADDAVEIVLPDGVDEVPEVVTTDTATVGEDPASDEPVEDGSAEDGSAEDGSVEDGSVEDGSATSTEPPKETVPLAEDDTPTGLKLLEALGGFNECLDVEGWEFLGLPNPDLGAGAPVNNPDYISALQLCNSRTGIAEAFQAYESSRASMTPDQIMVENEQTILITDCLRGKGWDIGELTPDENGLLNTGGQFSSPDGRIDADQIGDCVSRINLEGGDGS